MQGVQKSDWMLLETCKNKCNLLFILQALYTQYLQFKEHEIPQKENEKTKIKNLYKMLEVHMCMIGLHVSCIYGLTHCSDNKFVPALSLTDVDRVWTSSVTPGSSSE